MNSLIENISNSNTRPIILACHEIWKYALPNSFKNMHNSNYHIIHEPSMDRKIARKRGRPYGGIAFIISKSIAFKVNYINSRCLSILLTDYNILINNVYLPANDARISVEENVEKMIEAIGHFDAAHTLTEETVDYLTLGDFNIDANDI